jgi:hypothetical protein
MPLDHLLLRKCQRQLKADRFAALAAGNPGLALALARIQGPAAVQALVSDPKAPAGDRELAAWSLGDLRTGLLALRRRPGCQEIAEGWLLLLKGDHARAEALFAHTAATQPRRAAAGQAVALASAGRLAQAAAAWAGLGPVPGGVFPACGRFARQLTRHEAGWDPSALRQLVARGTVAEVETALRACPADRSAEQGWLALRLADLYFQASPGDQRLPQLWERAARHPPLRADVLKRRLWLALRTDSERPVTELADLHRLLVADDPAEARFCVEALTAEMNTTALARLRNPAVDANTGLPRAGAAIEWILVWMRQGTGMVATLRGEMGFFAHMAARMGDIPLPPTALKDWRPWLRLLDQTYADDARYIEAKLVLLNHFKQSAEVRLALYQLLLARPERSEELAPRWLAAALGDRRSRRRIQEELAELERRFPGTIELSAAHLAFHPDEAGAGERLAAAMPPARAAAWRWAQDLGPMPDGFSGDDSADRLLLDTVARRQQDPDTLALLDRHGDRLHQICTHLHDRSPVTLDWWTLAWLRLRPADWRGWYHRGRLHWRDDNQHGACQSWRTALSLLKEPRPEREEMRSGLGRMGWDPDAAPPSRPKPAAAPANRPLWSAFKAADAIGSLELAGLDRDVDNLDLGRCKPEDLADAKRQDMVRMIDFVMPFLHRSTHAAILTDLRSALLAVRP